MDHTATSETLSGRPRLSSAEALDAAYAGNMCEIVQADGRSRPLDAGRWTAPPTPEDVTLFVDPCTGPTLDVGCGPGRLTVAVTNKGLPALGIDISAEAVRLTRAAGGAAIQHDVFEVLPPLPTRRWRHILLADGNVGLGGDPVRLLGRLKALLETDGSILVEVAGPGTGSSSHRVHLRVDGQASEPFTWATVGTDEIERIAGLAELVVRDLRCLAGRHVATLVHC